MESRGQRWVTAVGAALGGRWDRAGGVTWGVRPAPPPIPKSKLWSQGGWWSVSGAALGGLWGCWGVIGRH